MEIKKEFTGMLPAAILKFEELFTAAEKEGISPSIEKGYDSTAGQDSFFAWGCACRMTASDMKALQTLAEALGITWLDDDGDMAYTNKQTIKNFKTFRVSGDLVLMPEVEEEVL